MGDPKQLRKKYNTPRHPWIRATIESERVVVKDFGLVKKKEIHQANSFLKKYKDIAKRLIATRTLAQAQKEKEQIMGKLQQLGLLPTGAELDHILGLELKDVLNRRLQSVVYRKGLSHSMKQSRQFITHRHIMVGDEEISSPSYLVSLEEEGTVAFKQKSAFADATHPERALPAKKEEAPKAQEKEIHHHKDKKHHQEAAAPAVEVLSAPVEAASEVKE